MRTNGTKYPNITKLPENALPVSKFATDKGIAVGQVYMKIIRFANNEGKHPGYVIRCFMGSNFVIPDKTLQK